MILYHIGLIFQIIVSILEPNWFTGFLFGACLVMWFVALFKHIDKKGG